MEIRKILEKNPVVYVTRDIERAVGLDLDTPGYFVIANYSKYAEIVAKNKKNVLLIRDSRVLDTRELLNRDDVVEFIEKNKTKVLVFKNTKIIERICKEYSWSLLNPKAELADKVEAKISQIEWLVDLTKYLPEHEIKACEDIVWKNEKFILQFNHSHSGEGTILVDSVDILDGIKNKFPKREARITKYVNGPSFTNNNIVHSGGVLLGPINYQITGLKPFTNLPFATVGNDWGVVRDILSDKQVEEYKKIAKDVGEKLRKDGWLGAYGIDVTVDEKTGRLYLIEINARQPASVSFESKLQKKSDKNDLTSFEAHLLSLLGIELARELTHEIVGAQVILKNVHFPPEADPPWAENHDIIEKLETEDLNVIKYNNKKENSDLLRIQSKKSIMRYHGEFNELGKKIIRVIEN